MWYASLPYTEDNIYEWVILCVCQVEERRVYRGLSDGRVVIYDLMKSGTSLQLSFDSSCLHDSPARRPLAGLAVAYGRVYYGDSGINLKVIDSSQGQSRYLSYISSSTWFWYTGLPHVGSGAL